MASWEKTNLGGCSVDLGDFLALSLAEHKISKKEAKHKKKIKIPHMGATQSFNVRR